jgi:hypothetical protein
MLDQPQNWLWKNNNYFAAASLTREKSLATLTPDVSARVVAGDLLCSLQNPLPVLIHSGMLN